MGVSERVRQNRKAFAGVGAALLVFGGVLIWHHQAIYGQLYAWKLIPRPERLTELYFTDRTLPVSYTPGQSQTVVFAVHNLEGRAVPYGYAITQQNVDGTAREELANGNFSLEQDSTKQIVAPVTLVGQKSRSRIVVSLTYDDTSSGQNAPTQKTATIHYWAKNSLQEGI